MIRAVLDWIQANTFLDFVIFFALTYVIEISKIKVNPWTWLGKKIGSVINHDVIERLDDLDDRLDDLDERIDEMEKQQNEDREKTLKSEANSARRRIINGADRIRIDKTNLSKECMDNLIDDCTFYKSYCQTHPDYKNDREVFSINLIEKIYQKCLEENSFL